MVSRAISILASALLYAASFPPAALSALAWIALVPFLVTVSGMAPGRAAAWGALWGFVAALGVVLWLPATVSGYFGVSPLAGWASCLVLVVRYGALSIAVFAAWLAWATRRGPVGPLAVAAAWGAVEFARAGLPLPIGNPWALVAYSQVGFPRLMQIADLTGPYGVGMLIAAVNACLAAVAVPALRGRRPRLQAATVGLALLGTLAYGTWRLGETFGTGQPVPVAVVQGALAHEVRRGPDGGAQSVARHLALTRDVMATRPGLVVWPENVVDFNLQDAAPERDALLAAARDLGTDLVLGGPSYTFGETGPQLHNSVFLVRRGRLAGRYDKLRLLPVAEQSFTGGGYTSGRTAYGLRSGAGLVGTFVCFEAMYPELVRRLAVGTELLANLSNDGWLGAGAPAEHHLAIASVRAIENRRYLVRATTSGISAVIDPYGRVLVRSGFDTPEVLTAEVRRSRTYTVYQRLGDAAGWAAVLLVVLFSLWHGSGAARRKRGGSNMSTYLVAIALIALTALPARAAVECPSREPVLPHFCDGGTRDTLSCDPDVPSQAPESQLCSAKRDGIPPNDCPDGDCAMVLFPGAKFSGVLTFIIDNNVSQLVNQENQVLTNGVAATVVLDLGKKYGMLAQTYQSLDSSSIFSIGNAPVDEFSIPYEESLLQLEGSINPDTGKARVVNDLLFRNDEGDPNDGTSDSEIRDALRALFSPAGGRPVVTKVSSVRYEDRSLDGLASVLQMKVKGVFIAPTP